ncbi:ABC transporter permease [Microbacterium sp. NPDC096154]|jgi:putative ABC transport system permease protein|uniref:ABC transporter permease n=1 Tax=Microbacterium sp. NPDC096154 TaxID=3155549 RepID=UPI00333376AE
MFLAWREIRHSKMKYVFIFTIMFLVSFLVLFVTGLAKGLSYANTSALEQFPTHYYSIQDDADQTFRRSQLGEEDLQQIQALIGKDKVSPLGVQTSTVTVEHLNRKQDVTFFAIDMAGVLAPKVTEGRIPSDGDGEGTNGEVIVDSKLAKEGLTLGSQITDQMSGRTFTIVGYTKNQSYSHMPVVFVSFADWKLMKGSNGQISIAEPPLYNVFALDIDKGQAEQLKTELKGQEIITQKQAIANIPGYAGEQKSLTMMIAFLYVIGALVLAVFFYVITMQKTSQFGILKAMGTKTSYLARSVIGQVFILSLLSLMVSLLLIWGITLILPSTMPFNLDANAVGTSCVLLLVMSLLGAVVSVFRVAKIDALVAIGGGQG